MKQLVSIVVLLSILFFSCDHEMSDELDGKWQLKEVMDENGITHPVDTVWYNMMNALFMYQLYDANENDGTYRSDFGFKYREGDRQMTLEIQSSSFLKYTDWTTMSRDFVIESHSGSKLTLSSEGKKYYFIKF